MLASPTYSSIRKVALPIIIGNLAQNIINVTDTAFIGRLGEAALGAAAIGGVFYLVFALLCNGLSIGSQIIIARRVGENNREQVGRIFNQNLYLLAIFSVLLFLLLKYAAVFILGKILNSTEIYHLTLDFLQYRSFGIFFAAFNSVFIALYVGLSETKVLTYTSAMAALVNIVLNYILIFGNFGFAPMGIRGAGLASTIAEGTAFLFFILYSLKKPSARKYRIFHFSKWDSTAVKQMIKLAYPTVFQYLVSLTSWFLFFIIIEKTGEEKLAVSNILRSSMILFMMAIFGLSNATNTMVSNIIGQNKARQIWLLIRKLYKTGYFLVLIFLPVIVFKPDLIIRIYTDNPALIKQAIYPLILIYCTLFIFVPGVISISALSGTGDTKTAFLIEASAIVFYLIYTWLTAIVFHAPLEFIWGAETVYWIIVFVLAYRRLKSGKWRLIAV